MVVGVWGPEVESCDLNLEEPLQARIFSDGFSGWLCYFGRPFVRWGMADRADHQGRAWKARTSSLLSTTLCLLVCYCENRLHLTSPPARRQACDHASPQSEEQNSFQTTSQYNPFLLQAVFAEVRLQWCKTNWHSPKTNPSTKKLSNIL